MSFVELEMFWKLTKSALHGERKCKGNYHQSPQAKVRGHSLKQKKMLGVTKTSLGFWKIDDNFCYCELPWRN